MTRKDYVLLEEQRAMTDDYKELDTFIESLGLEYTAAFVPQSLSRNSGEKEPSLNWRVTVARHGRALSTDYMQGIGHVPSYDYRASRSAAGDRALRETAEKGRYHVNPYTSPLFGGRPLPKPSLRDVLCALVNDASAIDYLTYEDWAAEMGMDPDSRKGERTYNKCREIGRDLLAVIGGRENLEKLRELFQGY